MSNTWGTSVATFLGSYTLLCTCPSALTAALGGVDPSAVSPVSQLLESVPASVQQEAVRGQALVLKQQGDTAAAKQLLADLVQSEGLEGAYQHLAQADYGILLLEQADLQVILHARLHVLMVGMVIVI